MKQYLSVVLFIMSIVCLIPGVAQPFMTIKADISKQKLFDAAARELLPPAPQQSDFMQAMLHSVFREVNFNGSVNAFEATRSLLQTMNELVSHEHVVVGLLIGLFGVIIPVVKITLTLIALFAAPGRAKSNFLRISSLLSKWSMSDVLLMAILVAFFTVNANVQTLNTIRMTAELASGFYFFTGYCLLAIVAGQLMQIQDEQTLLGMEAD